MDLAQKANKVKHYLNAAVNKLEASTVKQALDAFETFADAIVVEIEALKKANKEASRASSSTRRSETEAAETSSDSERTEDATA